MSILIKLYCFFFHNIFRHKYIMDGTLHLLNTEINEELLMEVNLLNSKEQISTIVSSENMDFMQWKEGDIVYVPKDLKFF